MDLDLDMLEEELDEVVFYVGECEECAGIRPIALISISFELESNEDEDIMFDSSEIEQLEAYCMDCNEQLAASPDSIASATLEDLESMGYLKEELIAMMDRVIANRMETISDIEENTEYEDVLEGRSEIWL